MKKLFLSVPLVLALYACGEEAEKEPVEKSETTQESTSSKPLAQKLSVAEQSEWEVDQRLQEPTEDTTCFMCNMKVYMRDHELGVFSAQAVREDGSVEFYDDIGCLLNDEYANNVKNEKFVRDYHTLNWFNVEEAFAVKTALKSPMNWGIIFFKFEEDAKAYVAENENAEIVSIDQIREEGIERYKKKRMMQSEQNQTNEEDDSTSMEHDDNMSTDDKDE